MENPYVNSQITSLEIIAQAEYLNGDHKKLAVEAIEWRLKNMQQKESVKILMMTMIMM